MDYLVIGHITKDLLPGGGYAIGGTSTYSALSARQLGLNTAIITAAEEGFMPDLRASVPAVAVHNRPSAQTTTFENIYTNRGRVQYLRGVAERITPADVPDDWRASSIVHLGPVAQEFDADLCDLFIQNAQSGRRPPFIGLTPQGWLRQWDIAGAVSPCQWERAVEVLGKVDAVVFGWEDLAGDERLIRLYAQAAPLAVMTLGRRGAVVFARDQGRYFAARKVDLRDSTGAGDIFATAFFVSYYESGDPYAAARFASVAASFSVEGLGIQAVPTRQAISGWLAANPDF